ncbi:MAG: DUF1156 domain-containing protein [Oscillospiraceae bacterium]|nr:DUF1156 domain-containing protein [Oscillospiraceae bacterium]
MAKKLIEVALPLEAINREAAYEKMPGIGPHPRGLHLWWARRPFTAARAVIWASLVDDPSSHPEQFPTEEEQNAERERLFKILSNLVTWKNSNNPDVLDMAKAEIMKSTDNNPPALLDPFAGGGAIPLEAQRLGLEAHAHDLNPVAVMINKAMIEIPPKFAGMPPVHPRKNDLDGGWSGAAGLAEDVRYYGEWMKQEAFKLIGHLYPKVRDEKGEEHNVIAWIWTRTVKCPNPVCGCEMPLARNFTLAKKKNRGAYIHPIIEGKKIHYNVQYGTSKSKTGKTSQGVKFKCILCGNATTADYIKEQALQGNMGTEMMAIVAEDAHKKLYLSPVDEHIQIAQISAPDWVPHGNIIRRISGGTCVPYGMDEWYKLFTNRQLNAHTTFSNLVTKAQKQVLLDGGSKEYAKAVGVYLAFAVDRLADFSTSVSRWAVTNEKAMNCFNKQAIPMTWDYPEVNVMGNSVGSFSQIIEYISTCLCTLPTNVQSGIALQYAAQTDSGLRNIMISTDPPYYDNIKYADLADFFYVWLRHSLKESYPDQFQMMLVPKNEELIVAPYRFSGSVERARDFFENGMLETCKRLYTYAREDIPVTIYYAYKQSETSKDQTASTGWETMLSAIIQAGFSITGTWPLRTEQAYRTVSMNTNALASSIVLVCRKRSIDAPMCTRRDFINALKRELKPALDKLQTSSIAPVDLAQSAIGPGMGVYSRYSKVLEADGTPMNVRSALQIINQELDLYFNEQDGELDKESRFCVELYTQCAFNNIKYGSADTLARAKNTSVDRLRAGGIVYAEKGTVRLLTREEIPTPVDTKKGIWLLTQQLTYAMEQKGVEGTAKIVAELSASEPKQAKALAYRLFTIADRRNWTTEAFAYNSLVTAWSEVQSRAADLAAVWEHTEQVTWFES